MPEENGLGGSKNEVFFYL